MKHRAFFLLACAVCLSWVDAPRSVSAQQDTQLEQVDAGIEDIGNLRTSPRVPMQDLRQPAGFDRVYQLRDGTQRFVRINGAIQAVFPRSTYTRNGTFPTVPPGTIYYIGTPESWAQTIEMNPALSSTPSPNFISPRQNTTSSAFSASTPAQNAFQPPTVWSNERYRQARIATLIQGNAPAS